jgi:ribonuclease HII
MTEHTFNNFSFHSAKVIRDSEMVSLAEQYGPVGSGYPADPDTIQFVNAYFQKHKVAPPIARKSWLTIERMLGKV